MKQKIILAALASTVLLAPPARADQISEAEARVKECASKSGKKSIQYAQELISLACTYQRTGKRDAARITHEEAMKILQELKEPESMQAQRLLYWAGVLALKPAKVELPAEPEAKKVAEQKEKLAQQADLRESEKLMNKALSIFKESNAISSARYNAYIQQINFFRSQNRKDAAAKTEAEFESVLKEDEKKLQDSNQSQIYNLASGFEKLAALKSGYFNRHFPQSTNTASVSPEEFTKSEDLRLRALAVYDRLPAKNPLRLEAHRNMVKWYELFQKNTKAKLQMQELGKLLGSNDPALLFPAQDPCPACGRG